VQEAGDEVVERSGTLADDPFSGRHPTSHERMTGLPWDASYHDGPAPWDIGQPQPAIVRVASEGGFAGAVLDAGCGTGENGVEDQEQRDEYGENIAGANLGLSFAPGVCRVSSPTGRRHRLRRNLFLPEM
jgi:hypothetical protein